MTDAARAQVRAYHQRSKHQRQRYAAGPEALDWDGQPDPWRRFAGAPVLALPLVLPAALTTVDWDGLPGPAAPQPLDLPHLGALLQLSLGLSAWKQQGPDRWAVRCNPSSGNLHPTEVYALVQGLPGLVDGLYHYLPRQHALERRAGWQGGAAGAKIPPGLWLGLSSIHWREAWKYGERAFRYCQLDAGHAIGGLRYAAAVLGWRMQVLPGLSSADLACALGLDRDSDFGAAEREEPEALLQVLTDPDGQAHAPMPWPPAATDWAGHANRLDPHPMYRWPVIDDVAQATRVRAAEPVAATAPGSPDPQPRRPTTAAPAAALSKLAATAPAPTAAKTPSSVPAPGPTLAHTHTPTPTPTPGQAVTPHRRAVDLIRQRRSAQRFDRRATMSAEALQRIVAALLPGAGLPWDAWPQPCRVHPVWFVHRVDGLAPGAYLQPRGPGAADRLRAALAPELLWWPVPGSPLLRLSDNPALAGTLRTLCCHQALAGDANLALAMLAEFDLALAEQGAAGYRHLLQEAGLLGQALYLQAEAAGHRGTGIGCFFDDALHELLGIQGSALQTLYHFTLGSALDDTRISSLPPYPAGEPTATEPRT